MIYSLYLVYEACKYSRLNGSLSLVCKSPDLSKPEEERKGEEEREEEEGESNKRMGSRRAKHENENNVRLWKNGEWFSGVEGASLAPCPHPQPHACQGQFTCRLAAAERKLLTKTVEIVPQIRPHLPGGGDWALSPRKPPLCFEKPGCLESRIGTLLLELQGTVGMPCRWVGLSYQVGWDIKTVTSPTDKKRKERKKRKGGQRRLPETNIHLLDNCWIWMIGERRLWFLHVNLSEPQCTGIFNIILDVFMRIVLGEQSRINI